MKLQELVSEYISQSGENENKRFRFTDIAISCLRALNLDTSGTPTIAILPISHTDTIPIPPNCIRVLKVGLVDAQGNVQPLGVNNNMALNRNHDNCGNTVRDVTIVDGINRNHSLLSENSIQSVGDHSTNGQGIGRYYGMGGGNNIYGYYKVDTEMGVIQIQGRSHAHHFGHHHSEHPHSEHTHLEHHHFNHIFLEYLADIKMCDGEFEIHPFIVETIKAGIYWKNIQRNDKKGIGERQLAEKTYWNEYNRSEKRFQSKTMSEWMATFRKANTSAVRW